MTKPITPGQLLEKVLNYEGISPFRLAKLLKVPPARVQEMLLSKRGFEDVTLNRMVAVLPGYSIEWWHSMMELVKAGRLVSDDNG
jgi:plasmid maintenance system antidote protein VapI